MHQIYFKHKIHKFWLAHLFLWNTKHIILTMYDYSTNLEKNVHILVSVVGIGVGGQHGGSQQNKTQRQAANEMFEVFSERKEG